MNKAHSVLDLNSRLIPAAIRSSTVYRTTRVPLLTGPHTRDVIRSEHLRAKTKSARRVSSMKPRSSSRPKHHRSSDGRAEVSHLLHFIQGKIAENNHPRDYHKKHYSYQHWMNVEKINSNWRQSNVSFFVLNLSSAKSEREKIRKVNVSSSWKSGGLGAALNLGSWISADIFFLSRLTLRQIFQKNLFKKKKQMPIHALVPVNENLVFRMRSASFTKISTCKLRQWCAIVCAIFQLRFSGQCQRNIYVRIFDNHKPE